MSTWKGCPDCGVLHPLRGPRCQMCREMIVMEIVARYMLDLRRPRDRMDVLIEQYRRWLDQK